MHHKILWLAVACAVAASNVLAADVVPLVQSGLKLADATEQQVLEWRRHIHANPELSWQTPENSGRESALALIERCVVAHDQMQVVQTWRRLLADLAKEVQEPLVLILRSIVRARVQPSTPQSGRTP